MTQPVRMAGSGTTDHDTTVTWTIAEGRRGRRWREIVVGQTGIWHALLLETDSDGRFSHLELASIGALWTLHPETNGTLHGNAVMPYQPIRHIEGWPFEAETLLLVEGSAISAAAIVWQAANAVAVGGVIDVAAVILWPSTSVLEAVGSLRIERLMPTRWRLGQGSPFDVDAAGAPILAGAAIEPLEAD